MGSKWNTEGRQFKWSLLNTTIGTIYHKCMERNLKRILNILFKYKWNWFKMHFFLLRDPMTKVFKKIKSFLINVTFLFFNSLVFRKCTHVWLYYLWTRVYTFQIDLQLYVYIYLERRYMYMFFENVNFALLYIMQHLDTSGTSQY